MNRTRKKTKGYSIPLPFEDLGSAETPEKKARAVSSAASNHGEREDDWDQLSLWADGSDQCVAAEPARSDAGDVTLPASDGRAVDDSDSALAFSDSVLKSDSPSLPTESMPAENDRRTLFAAMPASSDSNRSSAASISQSRRPERGLSDESLEAAAEALGLNLSALRAAAVKSDTPEFRRYLRERAAAQLKKFRTRKRSADPFDWEVPTLAAVPAFVEDRKAAELLYRSLRGEIETS